MSEREALERADRLIVWMTTYIGVMAPGDYSNCYADLAAHGIYMDQLRANAVHDTQLDLRD